VREYDLFVPLNYNDGSPIEPRKLQRIHRQLIERFGGLTFFPQPNEGFWKMGDVTYRDQIVVYRVLTTDYKNTRRYFKRLKEELKRQLRQVEILVIERKVATL
jgi:hypothetical protein